MARTADVHRSLWSEPWFVGFSADGKLLFVYSITNAHANQAVMYVIAEDTILHETKLTRARFERALNDIQPKLLYDRSEGALWVPGAAKLIRVKNEAMAKSVKQAVIECPIVPWRRAFVEKYGQHNWLGAICQDLASDNDNFVLPPYSAELHGHGQGQGHKEKGGSGGERNGDTPREKASGDIELVFAAWEESKSKRGAPAVLDSERRKLIAKWLRLYPVEDLVDAVGGWRYSPHHRGENDRGKVYNGLQHCLRDADRIEEFRDLARKQGGRKQTNPWLRAA